jgi:hypothetical protein
MIAQRVQQRYLKLFPPLLALCLGMAGCDYFESFFKEEKTATPKPVVPATTKKPDEPAPPAAPPPQSISLSLTPPIEAKNCHIELTAATGRVPAILQISSYADKQSESYPSVFIQAVAPTAILTDILDQPLSAKIFVALAAHGPFFSTPDGQPAQITVQAADDQHVVGKIENANLLDQASGQTAAVSGKFDGQLKK